MPKRQPANRGHSTSSHMALSENVVYPIFPMVLLIIIPFLNGYFIGGIPHFQTYPHWSWSNPKISQKSVIWFPLAKLHFPTSFAFPVLPSRAAAAFALPRCAGLLVPGALCDDQRGIYNLPRKKKFQTHWSHTNKWSTWSLSTIVWHVFFSFPRFSSAKIATNLYIYIYIMMILHKEKDVCFTHMKFVCIPIRWSLTTTCKFSQLKWFVL